MFKRFKHHTLKHSKFNKAQMEENQKQEEAVNNASEANQDTNSQEQPINEAAAEQEVNWEEKYQELNNTYLRLYADFENYRKKTAREKADLLKTASQGVLVNILPVVDNFERALKTVETATDVKAVAEGVSLIYQQLLTFLKQQGVEAIATENELFDTEVHEAITTIPVEDDSMKGKVIDCTQKGYKLFDKVIRFAKVVVGQ